MVSDTQIDRSLLPPTYVEETRVGRWFLNTDTWAVHVVRRALYDLVPLIRDRRALYPVVLDVGCGWGRSLRFLDEFFHPQYLIGIDIDPKLVDAAGRRAAQEGVSVNLRSGDASRLDLPSESVDLIFCHQTFHHLVKQECALSEFHRVLKPSGLLLFAESTRVYIESWIIRLLFRHPMEVQKSAPQYLHMIRQAGFTVRDDSISCPYLWWSQPDLGLREKFRGPRPRTFDEETLLNLVAVRH